MAEYTRNNIEPKKDRAARRDLFALSWPSNRIAELVQAAVDNVGWGIVADELMANGQYLLGDTVNMLIRNGVTMTPRRFEHARVMCERVGDEAVKALRPVSENTFIVDHTGRVTPAFLRNLQMLGRTLRLPDANVWREGIRESLERRQEAEIRTIDDGHLFNAIRFRAYGRAFESAGGTRSDGIFRVERIPAYLRDEFNRRAFPFQIEQLANRGESYRAVKAPDSQE